MFEVYGSATHPLSVYRSLALAGRPPSEYTAVSGGTHGRGRRWRGRLAAHEGLRGAHAPRALHALSRHRLAGRAPAAERRRPGLVLGRGRPRPRRALHPAVHQGARRLAGRALTALIRGG